MFQPFNKKKHQNILCLITELFMVNLAFSLISNVLPPPGGQHYHCTHQPYICQPHHQLNIDPALDLMPQKVLQHSSTCQLKLGRSRNVPEHPASDTSGGT